MVNISEYFGIPSFPFSESSPINEIKRYLLKIYELGERINGSIPAIDKELCKSLSRLSYDLFCNLKHSQKTFTVCKNQKIKDMRIQEDADGLSENDTLYIEKFFSDNLLEVFSELVSATLLPKKAQPSKLFVAQFYSRYCNKYFPVYFAKEKEKVYIFYEN